MGKKTDELLITFTAAPTRKYFKARKFHKTLLPREFNCILILKDATRVERLLGELAQPARHSLLFNNSQNKSNYKMYTI